MLAVCTDGSSGAMRSGRSKDITSHEDAAGNSSLTLGPRGYRSDGSCCEIATLRPIVRSADGDTVSGQLSFTGANGSRAVATLGPGATLQFQLNVNRLPFTKAPACLR